MVEVVNRQRKIKVDSEIYRHFAEKAKNTIPEISQKSITIGFISDRRMRELNKSFRSIDKTTDVLSFPSESDELNTDDNYSGDIVISLEQAARQAAENHLEFEIEIKQLILHGILHLCGYDHEIDNGEMNHKELNLRRELDIV